MHVIVFVNLGSWARVSACACAYASMRVVRVCVYVCMCVCVYVCMCVCVHGCVYVRVRVCCSFDLFLDPALLIALLRCCVCPSVPFAFSSLWPALRVLIPRSSSANPICFQGPRSCWEVCSPSHGPASIFVSPLAPGLISDAFVSPLAEPTLVSILASKINQNSIRFGSSLSITFRDHVGYHFGGTSGEMAYQRKTMRAVLLRDPTQQIHPGCVLELGILQVSAMAPQFHPTC